MRLLPTVKTLGVARMLLEGRTLRETAAATGVHRNTVTRIKGQLLTQDPALLEALGRRAPRLRLARSGEPIAHEVVLLALVKRAAIELARESSEL